MKKHLHLLVWLSTVACPAFAKDKPPKTRTLGEHQNHATIKLKRNQEFNVLFKQECRGCAQIWTITDMDKSMIALQRESHSNPSCINCAGGNQDHTFHFKATNAGTSKLSFRYFDKTYAVKLVVN